MHAIKFNIYITTTIKRLDFYVLYCLHDCRGAFQFFLIKKLFNNITTAIVITFYGLFSIISHFRKKTVLQPPVASSLSLQHTRRQTRCLLMSSMSIIKRVMSSGAMITTWCFYQNALKSIIVKWKLVGFFTHLFLHPKFIGHCHLDQSC